MFLVSSLAQNYEMYSFYLMIGGIIAFISTLICFFKCHIIKIIQDITGQSERHAIEHMVESSEARYHFQSEKIQQVQALEKKNSELIQSVEKNIYEDEMETVLLCEDEDETMILESNVDETVVFTDESIEVVGEICLIATKEWISVDTKM